SERHSLEQPIRRGRGRGWLEKPRIEDRVHRLRLTLTCEVVRQAMSGEAMHASDLILLKSPASLGPVHDRDPSPGRETRMPVPVHSCLQVIKHLVVYPPETRSELDHKERPDNVGFDESGERQVGISRVEKNVAITCSFRRRRDQTSVDPWIVFGIRL